MTATTTRAKSTTNPNRPTPAGYCANCGSTGTCKEWRERYNEGCVKGPLPLTLEIHEADERWAAIKAMTSGQRSDVLQLLSMLVPDKFDFAVAHRATS